MKSHLVFVSFFTFLLGLTAALAIDEAKLRRDALDLLDPEIRDLDPEAAQELWKRKGGGGGGRGGGSSGGSSGGSKGGSGSKGNSGSSSGGSSASRTNPSYYPNTQGTTNTGGYSPKGSGAQPRFGTNGAYYGGGAVAPYPAGGSPKGKSLSSSRTSSPLPYFPGYWPPYPIFIYPYGYQHSYYNKTSKKDEKREIICACSEYAACMCDDVKDTKFWKDLIKDGDYKELNKSLVNVADVNGKTKIILNGTLPNGTTAVCKSSKDCEEYYSDAASLFAHSLGLWPVAISVFASVFFF